MASVTVQCENAKASIDGRLSFEVKRNASLGLKLSVTRTINDSTLTAEIANKGPSDIDSIICGIRPHKGVVVVETPFPICVNSTTCVIPSLSGTTSRLYCRY